MSVLCNINIYTKHIVQFCPIRRSSQNTQVTLTFELLAFSVLRRFTHSVPNDISGYRMK